MINTTENQDTSIPQPPSQGLQPRPLLRPSHHHQYRAPLQPTSLLKKPPIPQFTFLQYWPTIALKLLF